MNTGPEDDPRISVIVPIYNRERYVKAFLPSLRDALARGFEVVVVDDGSTDGTAEAVEAAVRADATLTGVRLIRQANAGPGAARNAGAAAARGGWLAFFDSDDLWLPWTAGTLTAFLAAHAACVAVFFRLEKFRTGDDVAAWTRGPDDFRTYDSFLDMRAAAGPSVIGSGYFAIRRDAFERLGGFVPRLWGAEDTDLFFRLEGGGDIGRIESPTMVAARADAADSLTKDMRSVHQGLAFLLDRNREGAYRNRARAVEAAIADAAGFWIRMLFSFGYPREGYDLLLRRRALALLLRHRRWVVAAKLALMPLLSLVRPRNYRFRLRPLRAS